jgi:hypothetical protein
MRELKEAKDLNLYKKLLDVLGEYCEVSPATGVDGLLDMAIEVGKGVIPGDKKAMEILTYVLENENIPSAVHRLLNLRFTDLPTSVKPLMKNGRRNETAFWMINGNIEDKVRSLLNWEKGKKGFWCDVEGNKISLLAI